MRCPKCGQITPDDSRFCGFCGAKIEPPSGGSPISPPPPIGDPVPPRFEGEGPEPPRRGGRTALIIVLAALLLAAAALIIFLLAGRSGEGGSDAPPASAPAQTESAESAPPETEPVETEPAETEPAETEPVETEPEFEAEAVTLYYKGEAAGGGRLYMYADGSKLQISAQVTPARELPAGAYVWLSSDESVVTVTPGPDGSSCTLTRQGPGECVISVSVAGAEDSLSVAAIEAEGAESEPPETPSQEVFALLGGKFIFSSGAGAWGTQLTIEPDGSFSGYFRDSDAAGPTPELESPPPNGICRHCEVSGRLRGVYAGENEYTLAVTGLTYTHEPGTWEVKDGVLYRYTTPYGLEDTVTLLLYAPGRSAADLPEELLMWPQMIFPDTIRGGVLNRWCLRNPAGNQCFVMTY